MLWPLNEAQQDLGWIRNCQETPRSPSLLLPRDTSFLLLSALSTNNKLVVVNVINARFAAFAFQLSHSLELSLDTCQSLSDDSRLRNLCYSYTSIYGHTTNRGKDSITSLVKW